MQSPGELRATGAMEGKGWERQKGVGMGAVERGGGSMQGWRALREKYLTFGLFTSPQMSMRG